MEQMILDSWQRDALHRELMWSAEAQRSPAVLFKPTLSVDGDQYCFLLGEDLASGVAGFGKTAQLAAEDFDRNFYRSEAPCPKP